MAHPARPLPTAPSAPVRVAIIRPTSKDREQFALLLATWREGVKYLSASTRIKAHPAYRAIVAMGPSVVTLLLDELQGGEWLLHSALTELTGDDPVPPTSVGHVAQVISAWATWARDHGMG